MERRRIPLILGVLLTVAALSWGINPAQATYYANSPIIPKFVDALPSIPIATPDTATFPGSDYYQLNAGQFTWQFSSSLPATTKVRGYQQVGSVYKYLGPIIVAQRNRPVRLQVTNTLTANGKFFLPVDTNVMGAGLGPSGTPGGFYSQQRVNIHLHGNDAPWISDGTPHQWYTPAGETTSYHKGISFQNVPDMVGPGKPIPSPSPTDGMATYYYPNQQSGRLQFYHDHVFGITRLNVYAGFAAPYLIHDAAEDALINAGTIPTGGGAPTTTPPYGNPATFGIPLVIQDKTFVDTPANMTTKDPNWATVAAAWGGTAMGDLWFPHVYEFNQSNPATATTTFGVNPQGRWDYGGYVWPPAVVPATSKGYATGSGTALPATVGDVRDPSIVPEAFMDTMVVNGKAYPTLTVAPQAYRFRILNACNDRYLNLQLYYTDNSGPWPAPATVNPLLPGYASNITARSLGGTEVSMVKADGTIYTLSGGSANPVYTNPAYPSPVQFGNPTQTEQGTPTQLFYVTGGQPTVAVPFDGRVGGVPDPRNMGPQMIQIGTEGGPLPAPIVLANNAIDYDHNTRSITIGNVRNFPLMGQPNPSNPAQVLNYPHTGQNLHLGPAERADVIIDFSTVPSGSTLILYNDAPAPQPAGDPRVDYYTGNPDYSNTSLTPALQMGGAPSTTVGNGPNTRTIMKITVSGTPASAFNLANLQTALPTYFAANQPPPIIPDGTPGHTPAQYGTIGLVSGQIFAGVTVRNKTIAEDFDVLWGRMNAVLGTEQASTNTQGQQTFGFGFSDPSSEVLYNNVPQLWKVTHNGVDTHAIHFHLFNVQVVNRVDWVGVIKPPDPNEMGWKETVRMNPLEDIIVALKPKLPTVPFAVARSYRPLDPSMMEGMTNGPVGSPMAFWSAVPAGALVPMYPFTDPGPGGITPVVNKITNFGYEYVWHCHLLGHEENDMMRPIVVNPGSIHGWVDMLMMF